MRKNKHLTAKTGPVEYNTNAWLCLTQHSDLVGDTLFKWEEVYWLLSNRPCQDVWRVPGLLYGLLEGKGESNLQRI